MQFFFTHINDSKFILTHTTCFGSLPRKSHAIKLTRTCNYVHVIYKQLHLSIGLKYQKTLYTICYQQQLFTIMICSTHFVFQ